MAAARPLPASARASCAAVGPTGRPAHRHARSAPRAPSVPTTCSRRAPLAMELCQAPPFATSWHATRARSLETEAQHARRVRLARSLRQTPLSALYATQVASLRPMRLHAQAALAAFSREITRRRAKHVARAHSLRQTPLSAQHAKRARSLLQALRRAHSAQRLPTPRATRQPAARARAARLRRRRRPQAAPRARLVRSSAGLSRHSWRAGPSTSRSRCSPTC